MKVHFALFVSLLLVTPSFGATLRPRTIADIPEARVALQRGVSPSFYRSLLITPFEGWITVRGQLSGDRLAATRLVRSDLNGEYDSLALELANNLQIKTYNQTMAMMGVRNILVHLLVYQTAEGKLAVSFASLEEAGGTPLKYTGAAWLAVRKSNHLWETIDPPNLAPRERRGPRAYTIAVEAPRKTKVPRAANYPGLGIP